MFRLFGIFLAALITFSVPLQAQSTDLKNLDKASLDAMIKAYIVENPEVLRDSLMGLAQRENEERKSAALSTLFNDEGDPVMGNPDGDLVIYEFSDYNCGYCKRVFEPIQQVIAEDDGIRFVVKEFPILSQTSLTAAQAGIAAQAQGVFEAYHVNMMTARGAITTESILQAAKDAGADIDRLQEDMGSAAVNAIIDRTREAASRLEISGTPGLVIGTTVVPGAIDAEELKRLIAEARAEQG